MRPALAAERHAGGEHNLAAIEGDVADADIRRLVLVLRLVATLMLGPQILLVHQLDQARVAGPEIFEAPSSTCRTPPC